jgi:hypothetical protein
MRSWFGWISRCRAAVADSFLIALSGSHCRPVSVRTFDRQSTPDKKLFLPGSQKRRLTNRNLLFSFGLRPDLPKAVRLMRLSCPWTDRRRVNCVIRVTRHTHVRLSVVYRPSRLIVTGGDSPFRHVSVLTSRSPAKTRQERNWRNSVGSPDTRPVQSRRHGKVSPDPFVDGECRVSRLRAFRRSAGDRRVIAGALVSRARDPQRRSRAPDGPARSVGDSSRAETGPPSFGTWSDSPFSPGHELPL